MCVRASRRARLGLSLSDIHSSSFTPLNPGSRLSSSSCAAAPSSSCAPRPSGYHATGAAVRMVAPDYLRCYDVCAMQAASALARSVHPRGARHRPRADPRRLARRARLSPPRRASSASSRSSAPRSSRASSFAEARVIGLEPILGASLVARVSFAEARVIGLEPILGASLVARVFFAEARVIGLEPILGASLVARVSFAEARASSASSRSSAPRSSRASPFAEARVIGLEPILGASLAHPLGRGARHRPRASRRPRPALCDDVGERAAAAC